MFGLIPKKVGNGNREMFAFGHPLARMRSEFDTIFNRMFGGFPNAYERWPYPESYVDFEAEETDKEFVIFVEAPGFEAKDFDVRVTGNVLTLRAEHKKETMKKKEEYDYTERHLERSITLPAFVAPDGIEATYKNGILEVHVPKSEEAKPRRVAVKT
jgi:HSP20 family protein